MFDIIFRADTICAVSTPHGRGGISVLRISGDKSLEIVRTLCSFLPSNIYSHRGYHGFLISRDGLSFIDEVLVFYFKKGRSYTGEETIEISCHGSPIICEKILEELTSLGARLANKGEFTYRAFMNGKIDLVQAESVLSVIESQSKRGAELALRQLDGRLSEVISQIEQDIIWILAHLEASIDFSEEGIEVVETQSLLFRVDNVIGSLDRLVQSFSHGRLLKDGIRVLLFGRPNVGKSSLLNCFLQRERAIVTDVPGTTRDLVEGSVVYQGINFTFVDTAGIRESGTDLVEKIGVQRSRDAVFNSDIILFVLDAHEGLIDEDKEIFESIKHLNPVILLNKSDLLPSQQNQKVLLDSIAKQFDEQIRSLFVSSFEPKYRTSVLDFLFNIFNVDDFRTDVLVSSVRQTELLKAALELIGRAKSQIKSNMGAEFVVIDLKEALLKIEEVLGKSYDDQILDRIFREFCIGK